MVMSLTSLLTLQLATLAEYDQLHEEILSKEELAETTKQRILQLVKAIQDGRFNLERYLEQAEVLERGLIKKALDVVQAMVGLGSPVRHGRSCGFALNEH